MAKKYQPKLEVSDADRRMKSMGAILNSIYGKAKDAADFNLLLATFDRLVATVTNGAKTNTRINGAASHSQDHQLEALQRIVKLGNVPSITSGEKKTPAAVPAAVPAA